MLGFGQFAVAQTQATVNVVPVQNSLQVGSTLEVNITISNVQNLYGVDVLVSWNSSALQLVSVSDQLGVESHVGGVLHETEDYPIEVALSDHSVEGQYHLVATSQGDAAPFSGNGVITTLTFNVTKAGQTVISVISELADHPNVGETTSEFITHTDVNGVIDAGAIPEFPQVILVGALVVGVTVCVVVSILLSKRKA
jgi:hypothetical protein